MGGAHIRKSRRTRRDWITTGALILTLLGYANGAAWLATRGGRQLTAGLSRAHMGMLGLVLLWARLERLRGAELGLTWRHLGQSLAVGAGLAAAASLPIRAFFALPLIARWPIEIAEYRGLGRRRLLWLLCSQFFLGSALFEEVAFRGLLHAKLTRVIGARKALLVGSAVFTAWHLVIAWHNLRRCGVSPRWFAPFYGGILATLFGAGYLFGWIRHRTEHVAGSVVAHWFLVGHLLLEIARLGRMQEPSGPDGAEAPPSAPAGHTSG